MFLNWFSGFCNSQNLLEIINLWLFILKPRLGSLISDFDISLEIYNLLNQNNTTCSLYGSNLNVSYVPLGTVCMFAQPHVPCVNHTEAERCQLKDWM